jgi:hypothetical protein
MTKLYTNLNGLRLLIKRTRPLIRCTYENMSQSPISAKWLFKTKYDGNGKKIKWKAKMVVRGNEQEEGVNYFATYAPVVRWKTIRAVLATAAYRNYHLDVKTAFLNGNLKETIYMTITKGFKTKGNCGLVCLLQTSTLWS